MTIKSTGPLSMSEIAAEFGGSGPLKLSEYYRSGARVPNAAQNNAISTAGAISIGMFYGAANRQIFNLIIAANTLDYNIRNAIIAAGWDQSIPVDVTVTVNAGVYVGSTSNASPALDTDNGYPAGSILALVNNGNILGIGGNGGRGAIGSYAVDYQPSAGQAGGPGLKASTPITVTNNGTIAGGGGGGGGGGQASFDIANNDRTSGGGGGGGAGFNGGAAGGYAGCDGEGTDGGPGAAGTLTTGGGGGNRAWTDDGALYQVESTDGDGNPIMLAVYGNLASGVGGAGGALGQPGNAGGVPIGWANSASVPITSVTAPFSGGDFEWSNGAAGGAAGVAVIGNANITWATTGTRLGALT